MPSPIMGVGVSYDGKVYVTETTREQREEISLIQAPFLHEKDMELISTKAKRDWIIKNYSPRIAVDALAAIVEFNNCVCFICCILFKAQYNNFFFYSLINL